MATTTSIIAALTFLATVELYQYSRNLAAGKLPGIDITWRS